MSEAWRRRRRALAVSVLAGCVAACRDEPAASAGSGALQLQGVVRSPLAAGVEILQAEVRRGGDPAGRLIVLYAEPARIRAELILNDGRAPLAELGEGALAIANAGYFTPEYRPTGLLSSGGKTLSPFVKSGGPAGSGVLLIEGERVELLTREAFASAARSADFAVQAGPRIIEPDGSPGIRSDDRIRANRTALGRDGAGRLALAVAYAVTQDGPSLHELMRLLGAAGLGAVAPELALTAALNLDGGPSSGLVIRHPQHGLALPERTPVASALVLRSAR